MGQKVADPINNAQAGAIIDQSEEQVPVYNADFLHIPATFSGPVIALVCLAHQAILPAIARPLPVHC